MKKSLLFILVAVFLAGTAFFLIRQQRSRENEQQKTPKHVIVIAVKSEVSVKQAGTDTFLTISDPAVVSQGAQIKTSATGKARLTYPDGTVTILDGDTLITLTILENDGQRSQIELAAGSIISKVKNILGTGDYYQVQTENIIASVRGTIFATESRGKISKVYGIQDKVRVQARDPKKKDVIKGTETEISGGEKTSVATDALPTENQRLVKEKLTEQDYQKPLLKLDALQELDEEYFEDEEIRDFLEELQKYNLNDSELQEELRKIQELMDELENYAPSASIPVPLATPTATPKPSATPSPTPTPVPSITSLTPAAVPAGTDFFVNGTNFTTGRNVSQIQSVTIGTQQASFGIVGSTTLVVTAPTTPGVYDINVFTTAGARLTLSRALTVK